MKLLVQGKEHESEESNSRADNTKRYLSDLPIIQQYKTILERQKKEKYTEHCIQARAHI